MITVQSIRDGSMASGYKHVGYTRTATVKPYHAQVYGGSNDKAGHKWQGPARATALEAAIDYVNYMNGNGITPTATKKSAGHNGKREPLSGDPELRAALGVLRDFRAQRRGRQGYVYAITDGEFVKIGYSVNPEARVPELQTGNARPLALLGTIKGTVATEAALHLEFIEDNILQEWFTPSASLLAKFGIKEDA